MWRHKTVPRDGYLETVTTQGLVYAETPMPGGQPPVPYWNEAAFYEVTMDEVLRMEAATQDLYGMCLEAVEVLLSGRFSDAELALPPGALAYARASWERKDPSVYARFDLRFDGGDPVMYEINGDTPTGLLETGAIQWLWKEDEFPEADQWNSVHDRLTMWWANMTRKGLFTDNEVWFFHTEAEESGEEVMTVNYMRDTAAMAGKAHGAPPLSTYGNGIEYIGWDSEKSEFVDWGDKPIGAAFKLYPWEDILREEFGQHLIQRKEVKPMKWIEPAWKLALSTKAILPILWELHPGHPNLLPAYLNDPGDLDEWVAKPLQGREGDNITIHTLDGPDRVLEGGYGDQPMVYQRWAPPPSYDENYAVIGSWVIGGESAGMIVRESDAEVTDYFSRVVPHVIGDGLQPNAGQVQRWLIER